MEEQNILTGDIVVLNQIKSDINEHNINKIKLENLQLNVKELSKDIESMEKTVQDEVETTLKKRRDVVSLSFNQEIDKDEDKLKKIQNDRDKARLEGVKERIAHETQSYREDNKGMDEEIKEAFRINRVPGFCRTRLFSALWMTKGIKDMLTVFLVFIISFLVIPCGIYYFVPGMQDWSIFLIYFIIATLYFMVDRIITNKAKIPHLETFSAMKETKKKIAENKKKIKKIQHEIKKDKNEEMYSLGEFDQKMDKIRAEIAKTEAKKSLALEDFDNAVKPNIVAEIEGRDKDKIVAMKRELVSKNADMSKLEALVKEQRIYISANYEAYLGDEFANPEMLENLAEIIKSGTATTIGQAIAVCNEKK